VSYIDGDRGILRYRGYPIEQLAERSNFLEARGSTSSSSPRARHGSCSSWQQLRAWVEQMGSPGLLADAELSVPADLLPSLPCLPQVSYLVTYGSLPNPEQSKRWTEAVMRHSGERAGGAEGE
jgi:citrate synthase